MVFLRHTLRREGQAPGRWSRLRPFRSGGGPKGSLDVTPQLTDVVRDAAAIGAERMALLVELTEWHFSHAQARTQVKGAASALLTEWHLRQAARLAREIAEQERRRCAEAYGLPMPGLDSSLPHPVGTTNGAHAAEPPRRRGSS